MPILDQRNDSGQTELYRFSQLYELPEFVKQAGVAEVYSPPQNTDRYFADVREPHQFPIHSSAATAVSAIFFAEKQAEINPKVSEHIKARLVKAAEYWRISSLVRKIFQRHEELSKEAEAPDSVFGLVQVVNGKKSRHLPLRNASEVKAAADWFAAYQNDLRLQLPFVDRQRIANRILTKAAEYGSNISEHEEVLEKVAGFGYGNPQSISIAINNRLRTVDRCDPTVREGMQKLAQFVVNRPKALLDPAQNSQLAATIDQFDRSHNLLTKYSSTLPAPEDVIFQVTRSKLQDTVKSACQTTSGSLYDKAQFEKLSLSDVASAFGDDIISNVARGMKVDGNKMAEVAATFPRYDAEMLDSLMESIGEFPLAKEAFHMGLTNQQYAEIMKT